MCDYSLHSVEYRLAKIGDKLVTAEFANSLTRGFASINEPGVAVCLRAGTELVFDNMPEYDRPCTRWLPRIRPKKASSMVARFRQINAHRHDTHHDALEFPDGTIVLLTRFRPGQRANVLQLPPDVQNTTVPEQQRDPTLVG